MNGAEIASLVRITLKLYGVAARKATEGFLKNWIAVPGVILLLGFFMLVSQLLYQPIFQTQGMRLVGGLMLGLIGAVVLSIYYLWIARTIGRETMTWGSLIEVNQELFTRVIQTSFLIWIMSTLLKMFGEPNFSKSSSPISLISFELLCWVVLAIVFNPLSEAIIIRRSFGLDAFSEAFRFTRENAPEWLVPFLLPGVPIFFLAGFQGVLEWIGSTNLELPAVSLFFAISGLLRLPLVAMIILAAPACHWLMLFRAQLFLLLESSTRRKRLYLDRQVN